MTNPGRLKLTILVLGFLSFSATAFPEDEWTLEASVRRVLEVSPRVHVADAEITVKEGEAGQAAALPNPRLGLDANEKLGMQDGAGGADLTQWSISQPIPIGRLAGQSRAAKARLESARENSLYERLLQESAAASRFHTLQFMTAKMALAEERLEFAEQYGKNEKNGGNKNDSLVRYLAPLDEKRLDMVRADASQQVATAEGEESEALFGFVALLQVSGGASPRIAALEEMQQPDTLEHMLSLQEQNHPAILEAKHELEATKAGVPLAYGELLPDPSLTYYRERDSFDQERKQFDGVMLDFEVPVWDWKLGSVKKAKAEVVKAENNLRAVRQELEVELRQTYMHLGHLIEQAERYRAEILMPSVELFELTRKGFEVGESNVLSLIDAHDVYFDARTRYQELLYEAAVEAAEMRLAAGLSVLSQENRGGK